MRPLSTPCALAICALAGCAGRAAGGAAAPSHPTVDAGELTFDPQTACLEVRVAGEVARQCVDRFQVTGRVVDGAWLMRLQLHFEDQGDGALVVPSSERCAATDRPRTRIPRMVLQPRAPD